MSNVDDHLPNHGVLRQGRGWALSPAFDLNPDPGSAFFATTIDGTTEESTIALALAVAARFLLDPERAAEIVVEVAAAVRHWRTVAGGVGLTKAEVDAMAPAFAAVDRLDESRPTRTWAGRHVVTSRARPDRTAAASAGAGTGSARRAPRCRPR